MTGILRAVRCHKRRLFRPGPWRQSAEGLIDRRRQCLSGFLVNQSEEIIDCLAPRSVRGNARNLFPGGVDIGDDTGLVGHKQPVCDAGENDFQPHGMALFCRAGALALGEFLFVRIQKLAGQGLAAAQSLLSPSLDLQDNRDGHALTDKKKKPGHLVAITWKQTTTNGKVKPQAPEPGHKQRRPQPERSCGEDHGSQQRSVVMLESQDRLQPKTKPNSQCCERKRPQ